MKYLKTYEKYETIDIVKGEIPSDEDELLVYTTTADDIIERVNDIKDYNINFRIFLDENFRGVDIFYIVSKNIQLYHYTISEKDLKKFDKEIKIEDLETTVNSIKYNL